MSIEFDNLKIYYIIYKNNLLFNTKNMITKTLKALSIVFMSTGLAILLSWCEWIPGMESSNEGEHNVALNVAEAKEDESKLPSFEEVINAYKDATIWALENRIQENVKTIKNEDVTSEWKWKFSVKYGETKGNITFSFSGGIDKAFENLVAYFNVGLGLENGNRIDDDFPNTLDLLGGYGVFLEKTNAFFQLSELKIDGLKEAIIDEDDEEDNNKWELIQKFIKKVKGKWIEINSEKICDEESDQYSEEGCDLKEGIQAFMEGFTWALENKEQKDEKTQEIIKISTAIMKAGTASIFSTKVLTDAQETTYEGKPAYSFKINEKQLESDIKDIAKTVTEYTAKKDYEERKQWYDDDTTFEKYLQEELRELEIQLDKIFDKYSIWEVKAYLVYNEESKDYDLVIDRIELKYHNTREQYNYGHSFEEDSDTPLYVTVEENKLINIAYSSVKKTFVVVLSEDNEAKWKFTTTYSNDDESFSFKTVIETPREEEGLLENAIVIEVSAKNKKEEKTDSGNFNISVKLNREVTSMDNDLELWFEGSTKTTIGEKFVRPDTTSAIPFAVLEKHIEKLEKDMQGPSDRDAQRKMDLSQLGTAILSYYNNKGEYPKATWKVMSVKELEKDLKETVDLKEIPSDPDANNSFVFNWTTFKWEYAYKTMIKNTIKNGGYMLIAKTETANSANYLSTIPIPEDLKEMKTCWYITKWDSASTKVEDGKCTYTDESQLRYVYTF